MIKRNNIIIGSLLVALGVILGFFTSTLSGNINIVGNGRVNKTNTTTTEVTSTNNGDELTLEELLIEIVREKAYYYQDDNSLYEGALIGIINSLGDQYSTYLNAEDFNDINDQLNQRIYGIGVSVTKIGPYPMIVKVYDNSPAQNAEIKPGYIIKSVDGKDVKDMPLDEITNLIKGVEGTVRNIGVYTTDPEVETIITLSVAKVETPTVSYNYFTVDDKTIGYLKIDTFASETYKEVETAMRILEGENISNLIIDVRDNPGGLLSSVLNILDFFINTEIPFMYSETRDGIEHPYYLNQNNHIIDYDITVLINEYSASASEIFAATLNEINNTKLYGKTTYGKGTMQVTYTLNKETQQYIKITTERWLTSQKKWIQDVGVAPTNPVEQICYEGIMYIDAYQKLQYDEVNETVKLLQTFLNKVFIKGAYQLRNDGYFDKMTEDTVKAYQQEKGIEITGIVDHRTAYSINQDIINYLKDKDFDNQYQIVLSDILNN